MAKRTQLERALARMDQARQRHNARLDSMNASSRPSNIERATKKMSRVSRVSSRANDF